MNEKKNLAGWQGSAFDKHLELLTWLATYSKHADEIPVELAEFVQERQNWIADRELSARQKLSTIDMTSPKALEEVQLLMKDLAELNQSDRVAIADITHNYRVDTFVADVVIPLGFKASYTGESSASKSADKHLPYETYRITHSGNVRFYLSLADSIEMYAVDKPGKSTLLATFTQADTPNHYPTTETALQKLHAIIYAKSNKVWSDTDARLQEACKHTTWNEACNALGIGVNQNGHNDTVALSITPEAWLKANPTSVVDNNV